MASKQSVYGYIRVSTDSQAESGLSLDAQRDIVRRKMDEVSRTRGARLGRVFCDAAVSASRILFRKRPAGGQLFERVRRGDHIVIAKLDRGFRSTRDCLDTLECWRRRGVTVHILDIGVDTSSVGGQLLIGIMSTIAQWESQRIGERIRDAFAARRAANPDVAVTAVRVIGYSIDHRTRRLRPHAEERAAGRMASQLRDRGWTYQEIANDLNRRGYVRPANPFGPKSQRQARPWTSYSVRHLIDRCRRGWPINPAAE